MKRYDLVIAGAGPAGLTLASELADSRLNILLLDKKAAAEDVRYHSSGSFIDPADWALPPSVVHPIRKIVFSSKNQTAVNRGNFYTIKRTQLLSHLETKARKNPNLTVHYGASVKRVRLGNSAIREVIYKKGEVETPVAATLFADCSGNRGVFNKKVGLTQPSAVKAVGAEYIVPLKRDADVSDLFVGSHFKGGYGWIFPRDNDTAIIGYGTLFKEGFSQVEDNLKAMWNMERVAKRCEPRPLERHIAMLKTGVPSAAFTRANLVTVGDAALQANPLAGEGIRFVMDAARMAAEVIPAAIESGDMRILERYSRAWQRTYRRKYKLAYLLQRLVKNRSANDASLDFGVGGLNRLSDDEFSRLLAGDLGYLFLLTIAVKIKFQFQANRIR